MKNILSILILTASILFPQTGEHLSRNPFSLAPAGALRYGLYGYDNPATLAFTKDFDLYLTYSGDSSNYDDVKSWGLLTSTKNFGFGVFKNQTPFGSLYDYRISTGFGDKTFSAGFSYGWREGDAVKTYEKLFSYGLIYRPIKHFTFAMSEYYVSKGKNETMLEAAVRPFGNEVLTLFGTYLFKEDIPAKEKFSAGAIIEPISGVRIFAKALDSDHFATGIELGLGQLSLSSQSYINKDSDIMIHTTGIRFGSTDYNILNHFSSDKNYLSLNLGGGLKYQRYQFFDESITLLELITNIDAAKNDPSVNGIALNMTEMNINYEMCWELYEKLIDFKSTGKKVIVFFERGGMKEYFVATAADLIVLEPLGQIMLEGFLLGKTYFKGTLAKVGIGYEEFRYFKYKSAVEILSRDKMSDADREQRQAIVDDWFQLAKETIMKNRNLSEEEFSMIVNDKVLVTASEALKYKLADSLGRWEDVKRIAENLEGIKPNFISQNDLNVNKLFDDSHWGEKPAIAVVYGIGGTSLNTEINARSLSKKIEALADDSDVKAIVFRADSPGGDALAADLIATALLKCKEKKPVIVTQGMVAGSGGYWISMYGDTIIAAPNTITGSIGVIGGFFYNKEFFEHTGVSVDHVKKGDHADFGFGFTIPLLGLPVAQQNLSDEEKARIEEWIKGMYKDFVQKVAEGRKKSYDEIAKVAEGRVFSGIDGIDAGLVDLIGGMETAINIAAEKVGLQKGEYKIIEVPEPALFNLGALMPSFLPFSTEEVKEDPVIRNLKLRMSQNGKPLLMMPLDEEFYFDIK